MGRVFYIIPIVAFVLILLNAFFGHLIFGLPYDQDINKYSIYVHLQPEWNSYPGNILFDVTNVWSNPNPESDMKSYAINPSDISSLTDYNVNQLQYQRGKSYVELKHEFSNCETNWKPILYRYAIDIVRNKIDVIQGRELGDDPYVSTFPNISASSSINSGYAQFIPICTKHDTTTYDYAVSINDPDVSFDVYFVPSSSMVEQYLESGIVDYYEDCSALGFHSYSGSCTNIGKDSGLMIILPDSLKQSLTKIKVSIHEK